MLTRFDRDAEAMPSVDQRRPRGSGRGLFQADDDIIGGSCPMRSGPT